MVRDNPGGARSADVGARPAPRSSAFSRALLNAFVKGAPTPLMRTIRQRVKAAPIEEFVIVGRRSGRERHMLLSLFEVDGAWYAGHPNGTSQWIRNLEAAGGCVVIRRDGVATTVAAAEVVDSDELERVIAKASAQPAPAGFIYRATARHIRAVGRYFRLEPVSTKADPVAGGTR